MLSPRRFPARRGQFRPALDLFFLVLLGGAAADTVAAPGSVTACISVVDPTLRLACYDAAAGRTATAAATPAAASTPNAATAPDATAESRFGDRGQLTVDAQARRKIPSQIEARVKRVVTLPAGRYVLTLDNDQVWQTTEADWAVEFKAEDVVTIARLPLGGFQIERAGQHRSLGVKRTN
jgi:hypothetical protein